MKYCRHCGHQLSDTDNFCPKCGTNQNGGQKIEQPKPVKEEIDVVPQGTIVARDRRKWQAFVNLGSGSFALFCAFMFFVYGIGVGHTSIPIAVVLEIACIVLVIVSINCFINCRLRLKNKNIKEECIFLGKDAETVVVVDVNNKTYVVTMDDLFSANKGEIGKGGSLYLRVPKGNKYKTVFCGYCKDSTSFEESR